MQSAQLQRATSRPHAALAAGAPSGGRLSLLRPCTVQSARLVAVCAARKSRKAAEEEGPVDPAGVPPPLPRNQGRSRVASQATVTLTASKLWTLYEENSKFGNENKAAQEFVDALMEAHPDVNE